jgi:ribosome-binding factor A
MDAIRIQRIQSVMKDELSLLINQELKDPRIPSIAVTKVELTRDAKQATVFISLISLDQTRSDPQLMEECLSGLHRAKGYIKKSISKTMQLRFMPEFLFREDKGLENTLRVHELLKQISDEKKTHG